MPAEDLITSEQFKLAIGAIADAAAAGAVSEVESIMAYVKQLVTADITGTALVGALDDAAAAGAVTNADTVMAYIKQLVTAELAALALRGTLADVADDTTATATMVALLRQIAEATNNGTGAALGANLSIVDVVGNAQPAIVRKTVTYTALGDGAVGALDLFTVTGLVILKLRTRCTTGTTIQAGATIEVGVAGATTLVIAQTLGDAFLATELWHDAAPDAVHELDSVAVDHQINGEDIIQTIAGDTIDSGVIEYNCEWRAISADGNVVAA